MQKKKYFFFDIDGTLCYGINHILPDSTRLCLDLLRANGHFISIATGRLQQDAMRIAHSIDIDTLVADGGNSLTLNGSLLSMDGLPRTDCIELIRQLDRMNIPWAAVINNKMEQITTNGRYRTAIGRRDYFFLIEDPNFNYASQPVFYKIMVACSPRTEHTIDFGSLPHVRYTPERTIVEPTNKGIGIRKMMDVLGAPHQDVVVFGDGINDVQMFVPDWFSIAMGNACDVLQATANYVTFACDQDGIFYACKHFGWI